MRVDGRLRSLSPLWYARIRSVKTLHGLLRKYETKEVHKLFTETKLLNIKEFNGCMVGEAYGFDDIYNEKKHEGHDLNCKKCTSIAQRVYYPIKNPQAYNAEKYFKRVIKEFCNHAERQHGAVLLEE